MSDAQNAAARWLKVHDELLRGIAHALSNRIATVAAAYYMYETGDTPIAQVMASLQTETTRLELLLHQLRLLPSRDNADAEPATANEACVAAVNLHAHHADLRDTPCDIDVDSAVYPMWAEPQGFCHALLVALTTAKRNALPGSRVLLRVTGNNDFVLFHAAAKDSATVNEALNESDAHAAAWLLAPHGGTARVMGNGCELQVPTLLAVRRLRRG